MNILKKVSSQIFFYIPVLISVVIMDKAGFSGKSIKSYLDFIFVK